MLFSCEILLSFFIHKNSQKIEMESTDSSTGSQQPQLPPGFRFHPTDEELVVHYLKKKAASVPLPVSIIAEVDLYKFDPWELPAKAAFGEQEWYFFSPRDRKYPNGARPNRAATSGYWKATGTDKPVLTSGGTQKVGVKKALVFYRGKPPKGNKTDWIMHEYRLADGKTNNKPPGCDISKRGSLRLDDWVLCRIYKKNTPRPVDHERDELNINDHHPHHHMMNPSLVASSLPPSIPFQGLKSSAASTYGALLENEPHMFEGMMGSTSGHHQLTSSSQNSGKRMLPGLYWNDEGAANSNSPTTKRFLSESDGNLSRGNEHDQNNASIATLLSQLPQAQNSLHQQAMLGSLGDGVFRQPYQVSGMNWYG